MSTTKFIGAFITKVKDRDERIIYARASQDTLDRDGEIIRLSAWKDAQLNEFLERSGALLVSHNYAKLPVGRILRFDKRTDGLYFEAQLIKGTEAADEAWAVISQTGKCGFSVGFRPNEFTNIPVRMLEDRERESALKAGLSSGDSVLVYTDVELLEISLVSVPALPTATLIAYKAGALTDGMLCKACKEIDIEIEDDDPEVEIEPDPEVVLRRELSAIDAEREAIKRARASHKADDEAANIHRICMAMIREYMGSSRFWEDTAQWFEPAIIAGVEAALEKYLTPDVIREAFAEGMEESVRSFRKRFAEKPVPKPEPKPEPKPAKNPHDILANPIRHTQFEIAKGSGRVTVEDCERFVRDQWGGKDSEEELRSKTGELVKLLTDRSRGAVGKWQERKKVKKSLSPSSEE